MHNSSNSYKAGSHGEVRSAISYLFHSAWSLSIHGVCIISSNSVSELHLKEKQ